MDRAVKVWRMPPYKPETLSREDKPLFSTDLIHKARVLSIAWCESIAASVVLYIDILQRLSGDILVSHSAPALMRGTSVHDVYEENGTSEQSTLFWCSISVLNSRSCSLAVAWI